jgi:hypothetical protein
VKQQGLDYFLGRICTVFTVPTNRDFKSENPQTFPQPVFHYFVGRVVEVNHRGICIEQWNNAKKLRTFFFIDHIVSISEEEILDPSNPKDKEIIEEYKKVNEDSAKEVAKSVESAKSQKYIDLEGLQDLVKGTSR